MKNYRKILAGVLATSMVLGNSVVVFADEGGTAKGSGKIEGQVKQEVFSVVLPTETDSAGAFDYILDPLGLIANDTGSNGNKYDKSLYKFKADDTVFFYSGMQEDVDDASKKKMTYTSISSPLRVENKSSKPVKVAISLKASEVEGITWSADKTFASSTDTSLYFGIEGKGYTLAETANATPAEDTNLKKTGVINNNGVAAIEQTLSELKLTTANNGSTNAFAPQWNPIRNTYEYVAKKADKTTTYYEFQIEAACNTAAGDKWLDVLATGETPELEVVWSIQDPTGAQIKLDQTSKKITLEGMTSEQYFKSLTITDETGTYDLDGTYDYEHWDGDKLEGDIVLNYRDGWTDWMKDKLVTITLNLTDGSSRTLTFIGD